MASSFKNEDGAKIVYDMIQAIQDNKQYLSDIDGLIGDGDHGINMNKGFTMCKEALDQEPGNMSASLKTLSNVLMEDIGGSMGPLYGCIFRAMFRASKGKEDIDKDVFKEIITKAEEGIRNIGGAEVGDKTLLDTVAPAAAAYCAAVDGGDDFATALTKMKAAAEAGRDSTKDLVAKKGRASRLGERSRGVLDAGATSCCLLLCTIADSIISLLQ